MLPWITESDAVDFRPRCAIEISPDVRAHARDVRIYDLRVTRAVSRCSNTAKHSPRPLYSPDWSTVGAEWLLSFVPELLSRHFIVAWLAEVPRVAVFVTAAKGEREFVIYDRRCIDEVLLEAPLA
jgi:hypothetical protein